MQNKPKDNSPLQGVLDVVLATLNVLADSVLHEQPPLRRRKLEHLVSIHNFYRNIDFVCLSILNQ